MYALAGSDRMVELVEMPSMLTIESLLLKYTVSLYISTSDRHSYLILYLLPEHLFANSDLEAFGKDHTRQHTLLEDPLVFKDSKKLARTSPFNPVSGIIHSRVQYRLVVSSVILHVTNSQQ